MILGINAQIKPNTYDIKHDDDSIILHLNSAHANISNNKNFIVKQNIPNKIDLSKWTVNLLVTKSMLEAFTWVEADNQALINHFTNKVLTHLPLTITELKVEDHDLIIFAALYGVIFFSKNVSLIKIFLQKFLLIRVVISSIKPLMNYE